MKRLILILALALLPSLAQARNADDTIPCVYGKILFCTETSVTTSGANRSAVLDADSCYLLYGTDTNTIGTFEAIEYIQGDSAVDIGSDPGNELAAGEKIIIYTGTDGRYISAKSANASKHYKLCKLYQ